MVSTIKKRDYREIKLFYSPLFYIFVTALVYLCWYFDMAVYGFTAILVLLGVTVACCRDLSSIIVYPFLFTLTLYKSYSGDYAILLYACGAVILVAGFVIHMIRFRPWRTAGKPNIFTFGALALFLSVALSGIGAPGYSLKLTASVVGILLLLSFVTLLMAWSVGKDDGERAVRIALWAVALASFLAMAEFATHLLRMENLSEFYQNKILPGETTANQYANLMARCLPILFYLSVGKRKGSFLWLIPTFVVIGAVALTNSRATIFMTAILVLVAFILCLIKSKQRIAWLITFFVLTAAACAFVLLKGDLMQKLFTVLLDRGFADYHRFELWERGWNRFLNYPVFGAGLSDDIGFGTDGPKSASFIPYWYHNTVVQAIASFGAVGGVALAFYLTTQFYTVFSKRREKTNVIGFILLFIFAVSLLDIQFYTPQTPWQMIALTTACYHIVKRKRYRF